MGMNTSITPSINYDEFAPVYDRRYAASPLSGVGAALKALVQKAKAQHVLEMGCGTGHWLDLLQPIVSDVYGLDPSSGMLAQAKFKGKNLRLVRGRATRVPFKDQVFDLIFCVNAIHHFGDPRAFIIESRRLLAPGGALAVVGMNPHDCKDSFYVYHYFEGTYQTDVKRFPTNEDLQGWMGAAGFERLEWRIAEKIKHSWFGRDVFNDLFLRKESTSQLTLLSDAAYAAGLERIESDLAAAEAEGQALEFPSDLLLQMTIGYLGKE
jgi:ubiquinone/menaquinone biosynthesis C-methylase UbiE